MRRGIATRVRQLEAHRRDADTQVRVVVVWKGDPLPPGLTDLDLVIVLSRECDSAEE